MVKSLPKEDKNLTSKHLLNVPKDGFIQKNKNKKFKVIPTGKVPLINGSKKSNSNNMKNNTPQESPEKNKGLRKKDVEKLQESLKKQKKNKPFERFKEDESINEGIVLQDSIMENSDESESSDSNKSEEEKVLPDIFGASLADDSDEDDEDYEEDKKVQVNKGVKMFDGVKSNDSIVSSEDKDDSMTDDDYDEDEDEDEYDDDDDDEKDDDDTESEIGGKTDESSAVSLKVLLGDSLSEDEDDEDFNNFDENNETDDTTDEEDEKLKNEGSNLLKTLVGDTIIEDDNDDDDFVEPEEYDEDDDDISDEEDEEEGEVEGNGSLNSHQDKDSSLKDFKGDERTIFVGNLPKDVTKKQLQKLFKQFGKIDAIRFRGKISKSLNIPKRVAAITNDLHPKMKSIYAYIRFESEESTKKALSINGRKFGENYIRVDMSMKSNNKYETKKSIFIGNLHFNVDDNSIRKHFKRCGEIESVRIIRDNQTGVGKGFGYVNFKSEDAVALALELDGTTILNREVRVKPNIGQDKRTKEKHGKRYPAENNHNFPHKKLKNTVGASVAIRNKENATKRITKKQKFERKETSPQKQGNNFQGQKSDVNKKKSKCKLDKKKKLLAEKLMAKPKKSSN